MERAENPYKDLELYGSDWCVEHGISFDTTGLHVDVIPMDDAFIDYCSDIYFSVTATNAKNITLKNKPFWRIYDLLAKQENYEKTEIVNGIKQRIADANS